MPTVTCHQTQINEWLFQGSSLLTLSFRLNGDPIPLSPPPPRLAPSPLPTAARGDNQYRDRRFAENVRGRTPSCRSCPVRRGSGSLFVSTSFLARIISDLPCRMPGEFGRFKCPARASIQALAAIVRSMSASIVSGDSPLSSIVNKPANSNRKALFRLAA